MLARAERLPPGYDPAVAELALHGLLATRKTLPPKLFYDDEGCRLFGEITRLPEYYPTRTEMALLHRVAPEFGRAVAPGSALIEYGGSDETKALVLLDACPGLTAYVPIDVAAGALAGIADRLRHTHPRLAVHPVTGDFLERLHLPEAVAGAARTGFFPGSTIGNLDPAQAGRFLSTARHTLGPAARFLVGVDLRKAPATLVAAYDDAQGITAAFNLNLLHRLNRETAAEFDLAAFDHRACWNEAQSRIEMHLVSLRSQTVRVAGREIPFAEGETIHTENSYKYSIDGFQAVASAAGWRPLTAWTDEDRCFSLHLLENLA